MLARAFLPSSELVAPQLAPRAGLELAQSEPTDLHAHQLEHVVAERRAHAAHLAVLALAQRERVQLRTNTATIRQS